MKTLAEVKEWRIGAAQELGDPSAAVALMFARFLPRLPERVYNDEVVAIYKDEALGLSFEHGRFEMLPIDTDGPLYDEELQRLVAFGMRKVRDGLWHLTPSLNMPGVIHAFVCIYDVPIHAPWENRIIVVNSLSQVVRKGI
jgi:hypothetical protein